MKKTLIVFGTRKGITGNTAAIVGETLVLRYKHHVEITNIRYIRRYKNRLSEFDNIVAGSSIMRGRWVWAVIRFLKRRKFENQKVALFVIAGKTMNKAMQEGISKPEAIRTAVANYIDPHLKKFSFEPVSKMAFGGWLVKRGIEKFNNWKREDISIWSAQLGKLFE
jgi:menaquinone-dependent protoporphyrinogen IX oxidase